MLYKSVCGTPPCFIYVRQPLRASRVLEGAMRAADQTLIRHPDDLGQLLAGMMYADATTSPMGAMRTTDLLNNKRLAMQSCSQLISTLKVVSQPVPAGLVNYLVTTCRMQLACAAAASGASLHMWARGDTYTEQRRQEVLQIAQSGGRQDRRAEAARAGSAAAVKFSKQEAIAAPCYPLWLAATGRSLLTVGRLMHMAQPWLQHNLLQRSAGTSPTATGMCLSKVPLVFDWLLEQLEDLQELSTEAAAARVPPAALQELRALADSYAERFDQLGGVCFGATEHESPAAVALMFQAFLQGCMSGWLPEGLQQLGAKVWAAWPQKLACNDDLCVNLNGLTEQSCKKSTCSGCKVAYYCCKEHQERHWKQHKKVCKHLQQLAKAAANGSK